MIYFLPIGVNLNSQPPDFLRVSGITGNVNRHERTFWSLGVKRNGSKLSGVSQYKSLASISAMGGSGTSNPRRRSGLPDRAGRFRLIQCCADSTRSDTFSDFNPTLASALYT